MEKTLSEVRKKGVFMQLPENVHENPDKKVVERLRNVMAKNGGYCPCRIQKTEENLCICKEFRDQMADPSFHGYCHCKLYCKE